MAHETALRLKIYILVALLGCLLALVSQEVFADSAGVGNAVRQGGAGRGLTVEDALRINVLNDVFFSPDSGTVTLSIERSWNEGKIFNAEPRYTRNDIWLRQDSGDPVNISHGGEDGSSFWYPAWAPNGRYLAMLSTRGGSSQSIHVWIWDRDSRKLTRIEDLAVETLIAPLWISDEELVVMALPPGERSLVYALSDMPRLSQEFHARAWLGKEPSSSVLESGLPVRLDERPQQKLLAYNVRTRARRVLLEAQFYPSRPVFASPDGNTLAGVVATAIPPLSVNRLIRRFDNRRYQIRLLNREGLLAHEALKRVKVVVPHSLRWSADGSRLFFVGSEDEAAEIGGPGESPEPETLFALTLASGELRKVSFGAIHPVKRHFYADLSDFNFLVTASDDILIQAYPAGAQSRHSDSFIHAADQYGVARKIRMNKPDDSRLRKDWWLVESAGPPVNLTSRMNAPPDEIFLEKNRTSVVGLVQGKLWRIGLKAPHEITELSGASPARISSILWTGRNGAGAISDLVVETVGDQNAVGLSYYDLDTGKALSIPRPDTTARFLSLSDDRQSALFRADSGQGTFVWTQSLAAGSKSIPVLELNAFLREVGEARSELIHFRSHEQEPSTARLIFPLNYRQGTRYPLVVAPTVAPAGALDAQHRINSNWYLNYHLLSARGYAVLEVNVLRKVPFGEINEKQPLGVVMPAVDSVVERGIADPDRLALWGPSNMGYLSLQLITQTDRFAAAISLVGPSDLIGSYLNFDITKRYGDYPHEDLFQTAQHEAGAWALGAPPWQNPQIWIRNSPVFAVDKVNTPVLLMYGDLDGHPMQHGEAFFNGLYRQGKRARFVRYFGEGHGIYSPANFRDMWAHTFRWLEENSCPANSQE